MPMASTLILKSLESLIEGIYAVRPRRGYMVECQLNDAFSLLVLILDCENAAAILDKTNFAQQFTPQKHYRLPHPGQ
ncbi:hypothetical protein Tco_1290689, partial [Tanacetum coccineum]